MTRTSPLTRRAASGVAAGEFCDGGTALTAAATDTIGRLRIVLGTTNPAKARQCRLALRTAHLRVLSLAEALKDPPEVVEDGSSAEENAARKAAPTVGRRGFQCCRWTTHSRSSAFRPTASPGLHVRRIPGVNGHATDDELLAYYGSLFARYGSRVEGRWDAGRPSPRRRAASSG